MQRSKKYPRLERPAGRRLPPRAPLHWMAAALIAIVLSVQPALAQDPGGAGWRIQGGPMAGISFVEGRQFEVGLRLGAKYGAGVVDLSLSTHDVVLDYWGSPTRDRIFEALAGVTWQPSPLGVGFRLGYLFAPDRDGKLWPTVAFGPHYTLIVPIGPKFEMRSEAGAGFLYDSGLFGFYRNFVRIGLERRLR